MESDGTHKSSTKGSLQERIAAALTRIVNPLQVLVFLAGLIMGAGLIIYSIRQWLVKRLS
jgi:hypothetical protein